MADENKDEQIEYEAKKPLLDAFKDLFKRPAALPGDIPSKHKVTNVDMKTSMTFREFRANLMKKVGDFFQSLSNIGSTKQEVSPNKYINNNTQEKSTEKLRTDNENIVSQQPIIPTRVSPTNVRTLSAETLDIDTTAVEDINKTTSVESTFESDSSADTTPSDIDKGPEVAQITVKTQSISTGNIIAGQAEPNSDKKPKHVVRKRSDSEKGDFEL